MFSSAASPVTDREAVIHNAFPRGTDAPDVDEPIAVALPLAAVAADRRRLASSDVRAG